MGTSAAVGTGDSGEAGGEDGDGEDGGGEDTAALIAAGVEAYDAKCAVCHDNNGITLIENGYDADMVAEAVDITDHGGVAEWPTGDELAAMGAAFATP